MKRAGGRDNFTKISIRHIRKFILYISVQLAVICILMEIYGRLFDPFGISYYPQMSAYLDTMIIEEPIGYRNRPNLNGNYFGVPVTINSLGMRDREVSHNDDGEFRILFMGDSLPFGVGVRYEDSLPYRLEEVLNSRRRGNPYFHYRTLNMGVISYNTEQELIQLEQVGLLLKPRLAVLVYSDNDIEPKMFIFNKRRKWYLNLGQRSYAVSLIYTLAQNISKRVSVPDRDDRTMKEYYTERWKYVDNSFHEINALLRSKGVPFVLFTTEKKGFIFDLLKNSAKREGFPLVTLDYRQDLMKFRNSYIDAHPNKAGNEFLAGLIAEALEREGVLDHSGDMKDKNELP
jgi:hypothetical protein